MAVTTGWRNRIVRSGMARLDDIQFNPSTRRELVKLTWESPRDVCTIRGHDTERWRRTMYVDDTALPEQWRPIPSTTGRYEASSYGRIRRAVASRGTSAGRVLTLSPHSAGYLSVTIQENHANRPCLTHRLVAEAFHGPIPDGQEVNHIDGIKTNNRPSNLEYMTRRQNIRHAMRTGLMRLVGEDNPCAILTAAQVAEIRRRHVPGGHRNGGPGYKALAAEYGVTWEAIRNIIKGRAWANAEA